MARARPYWTCRCSYRNERAKRKCISCGKAKPRKKTPKHKASLYEPGSYEHYVDVARVLHGVEDESCCVCGRPKSPDRRPDRDHDHRNGNPRGLVCPLDNMLMKYTQLDAAKAQLIADYLKRAERYAEVFRGGSDEQ